VSADSASATAAWALKYAVAGIRVFPVVHRGKRPLYAGWQRDATTDVEQIVRYWRREPGPNIGAVAGELFDAWDIEARHLPAFREYLQSSGQALPLTPIARTGRGGIHILTKRIGIASSRDLHLEGVHVGELKSSGGYILVCPSVTVGPYSWLRLTEPMTVASAPGSLLALLERPRRAIKPAPRRSTPEQPAQALDALAVAVRDAGIGRRNRYLYWALRRAREEGAPSRIAAAVLTRAALAAGLDEREIEATIRSALGAETRE
jgi:hypothetical protein